MSQAAIQIKFVLCATAFMFATHQGYCCASQVEETEYDIVVSGARVVDPETGLNDVMNIGIKGSRIATITRDKIEGATEIVATNMIAAPGFIDLHVHGQDPYSEKLGIRDGRTSQLDLEAGAWPVSEYYEYKQDNSLSNYGASVGHAYVRLQVLDGISANGSGMVTHALERAAATGNLWASAIASDEQLDEIDRLLAVGLDDGGLGIGVTQGYYVDARSDGIARTAEVARQHKSFLTTHSRYISLLQPSGALGLQEMISLAVVYDVPLLIHHVPTNALADTPYILRLIQAANQSGANIVGEAFPYVKGSTFIGTRILDEGWQERMDMDYSDLQWVETGETLTKETFEQYRRERPDGLFIMEHIKQADMVAALLHPDVIVGSDGMTYIDEEGQLLPRSAPFGDGSGHPRGAGTYAKYLRIAIDEGSLTLPQILAKTSYLPAKFLEPFAPMMKERGRLQEGMLADITIFDPKAIKGKAGYERGTNSLPSEGIPYVIVNGQLVVHDGVIVEDTFPGVAIRREIEQ